MTPPVLLGLLQDFYRDTLDLALGRQANARLVAAYDVNNAYQQVLGRQDEPLRRLSDAIGVLGGSVPDAPKVAPVQPFGKEPLQLILGEMAEHLRVFQQALEGRTDLLGRHTKGKVRSGEVRSGRPTG